MLCPLPSRVQPQQTRPPGGGEPGAEPGSLTAWLAAPSVGNGPSCGELEQAEERLPASLSPLPAGHVLDGPRGRGSWLPSEPEAGARSLSRSCPPLGDGGPPGPALQACFRTE